MIKLQLIYFLARYFGPFSSVTDKVYVLSTSFSPTQFFNSADVNNTIMKVLCELQHVACKKQFVNMNTVACERT